MTRDSDIDPEIDEQPGAGKLPARGEAGTRFPYRSHLAPRSAPASGERPSRGGSFARKDLRELCRQPWMYLVAALACIAVTFLVTIYVHGRDERRAVDVANAVQAENPAPKESEPVAVDKPVKKTATPAAEPDAQAKGHPKVLPLDELQALNPTKQPGPAPIERRPQEQDSVPAVQDPAVQAPADNNPVAANPGPRLPAPVPGRRNPVRAGQNRVVAARNAVLGRHNNHLGPFGPGANFPILDGQPVIDDEEKKYTRDPATGVLLTEDKRFHVRTRYYLPIDGPEIHKVRLQLMSVSPVIELQWWYPRSVSIPEQRYKGKIAKMRFLAIVQEGQLPLVEDRVRVVRTLGSNPGGPSLVEVEALFYLFSMGGLPNRIKQDPRFAPPEHWVLLPKAIQEKPSWFPEGKMTIKRGDTGQLAVKGEEIEEVRKAVSAAEETGLIREVKWWAPRANPEDKHRLSKLRYEVVRNGDVRLEEMVFDYDSHRPGSVRQATDLFPEDDPHSASLEPVPAKHPSTPRSAPAHQPVTR
jgi:hypothetical protein